MRHYVTLTALFFLFCKLNYSQFHYGFRGGITAPAMLVKGKDPFTNQDINTEDYKYEYTDTPFYIGIFGSYQISEKSEIQADLYYSNNGFNVKKEITYPNLLDSPTQISIHTPEIILDALYKYKFSRTKLVGFVGTYISRNLNNTMTTVTPLNFPDLAIDIGIIKVSLPINVDIIQKAQLRNFDFGFILGSEYALTKNLFIEARANFGIVDMTTEQALLKITDESLSEVTPAFARGILAGSTEVINLAKLSDENGKTLESVDAYRAFIQIGISWRL